MNPTTPNSRNTRTLSSSSNRYVIGHSTPVNGPTASKYAHTFFNTRSGMKCVCTSTNPGTPIRRANSLTWDASSALFIMRGTLRASTCFKKLQVIHRG
ncbi:hypothetical protein GCM10010329_22060 [Streptomyces spiroverticillatus]|uniref:Uncharacterized protein n=1 Tax=Streptomyces finlayi TaxID=67296 RepID=A0A918WUP4_9ACTN|nr:hypothetical protein GCM10010329_22060 [Streptomyces spiroverticillatus]GHC84528.1 hypothetical protein GCM10010334_14490 [Streptomyces finlayi]